MEKISLNLKIEQRQLRRLDDLARHYGCNRSEIARLIFDNIQLVNRPVPGAVIGSGDQRIAVDQQTAG